MMIGRFTLNDRPATRIRNNAFNDGKEGRESRIAEVRASLGDELASIYATSYRRGREAAKNQGRA